MKNTKNITRSEAAAILGKNSWKIRSQGKTKEQIASMMSKIKKGKKKLSTDLSTVSPLQ